MLIPYVGSSAPRLLGSSAPRLLGKSFALTAALLLGASGAEASTTWHVQAFSNGSSTAGPNGDSATIAGILIQPALAAGDTIIVYENWFSESWSASGGTATPPDGSDPLLTIYNEDIVFPAFNITIKAAPLYPGQGKVIELKGTGTSSVVSFTSPANTRLSVLEGFTILDGVGSSDDWLNDNTLLVGGGIKCLGASPTIKNCVVKRNKALMGGGVYASIGGFPGAPSGLATAGPLLLNCDIDGNEAKGAPAGAFVPMGGGVMAVNCSPEIDSTTIQWNLSTQNGAGVALWNLDLGENPPLSTTRPIVRESSIHDNTAWQEGGGFYIYTNVNPLITHSQIQSNVAGGQGASAGRGGGFYWVSSQVELDTCHIHGNLADLAGGGIYYEGESVLNSLEPPTGAPGSTLTHCTIDRNQTTDKGIAWGGGIRGRVGADNEGAVTTRFENCLIVSNHAENGGGAYFTYTKVSFQNCTISQNSARGTSLSDYVGGIQFDDYDAAFATVSLQDTIVEANRSVYATPPNPWQTDFQDQSNGTLGLASATFANCMMSTATTHPQFAPPSSNLAAVPAFVSGGTSTYFPNAGFYLSHMPQQASTSPAYNVGSQAIGPQLAVNGMTCRTIGNIPDTGIVDMGFHYPYLNPLP